MRRNIAENPLAKRIFGLQAKSPSLFLSLYLNLFLSPPPLGGTPPPAGSLPPARHLPLRGHDPRRGNKKKPAIEKPIRKHPNEKDGLQRGGEATCNDGTLSAFSLGELFGGGLDRPGQA